MFVAFAFFMCSLTNAQNFKKGSFEITVPWNSEFKAWVSYRKGVPDG